MLGIGMQEMMIIALAGLLIFGPGKLPEVMGQAGKLYKDFRNMTSELTGEFDKTIAEAKKMGADLTGELGPMQKQVESITKSAQKDLSKTGKSSTSSKSTPAKSTSSSTSSAAKKSTSTRTSSSKSTSSSSTATRSSAAKSSTTATATKKPTVAPVATKEDPHSDLSMFALEEPTRTRRARRAIPSLITDPTPREMVMADREPSDDGARSTVTPVNDAIARARQRRMNAGYAQRSA